MDKIIEKLRKTVPTSGGAPRRFSNFQSFARSAITYAEQCDIDMAIGFAMKAQIELSHYRAMMEHLHDMELITEKNYDDVTAVSEEDIIVNMSRAIRDIFTGKCDCKSRESLRRHLE